MLPDYLQLPDAAQAVIHYLWPAAAAAVLLKRLSGRYLLFSLLSLPGTFVHEFLHLTVGTLTGAKPVAMDLFPRRDGDRGVVMGSVTFTNLRWFNAAPACLAPILGLPMIVGAAWLRVRGGWQFQWVDLAIWSALAPQFSASIPSRTDLRVSLISWPLYAVALGLCWYVLAPHS